MIGGPKILCVFRSGGDFLVFHVKRLADQVRAHANVPFLCLTDRPEEVAAVGVEAMPISPAWSGWWAKIHALRVPGPCLYLDLDSNVVGDLTPLLEVAAEHEFLMCRGFWGVDDPNHVNSSVLGWRDDVSSLYKIFYENPKFFMKAFSSRTKWGDQAYIRDTYTGEISIWQDILPGMIASYKRGALMDEDVSNCRVLCSHGQPRPWDQNGADAWLAKRHKVS